MLSEKKIKILEALSNLEILSRSQIQQLCDTKSTRNTNYLLTSLASYLNCRRLNENVYCLNKKGVDFIGSKRKPKLDSQIHHKLMRSDAYIYFKPTKWHMEREVIVGDLAITPDALYYSGSSWKFLEVDNTQKMVVNKNKMKTYQKIKKTQAFQKKYGYFPPVIWVTKYEIRKKKLKNLAKELNLFCEVYYQDEIKL